MQYTVVTRHSALAQKQTDLFVDAFQKVLPDVNLVVQTMSTIGDQTQGTITNLKKAFVGELEVALCDRRADLAVHSLKDMSVLPVDDLVIAAVLPRHDARDVFVSVGSVCIQDLSDGAVIGTSSARRCAQIKACYPHLRVRLCRGNVNTRIEKLKSGLYDGLVLAKAGLDRLQVARDLHLEPLPIEHFTPACGQGVVAVQCRADNLRLIEQLSMINHQPTYELIMLEQEIVRQFGASCGMPLGVYAQSIAHDAVQVHVFLSDPHGFNPVYQKVDWSVGEVTRLDCVRDLVQPMLDQGGREILEKSKEDINAGFD